MSFTPDEALRAELKEIFAAEAAEHLASLNKGFLALEKGTVGDDGGQLLKDIFRDAHSLKGGASAVGLQQVRMLAHHLESVLERLQDEQLTPTPDMFDIAYQTLDVIERLAVQENENEVRDEDVAELLGKLESWSTGANVSTHQEASDAPEKSLPIMPPQEGPSQEVQPLPPPPGAPAGGTRETVRIATSKLDELMAQVGELVVASGGSQRRVTEVAAIAEQLRRVIRERPSDRPEGNGRPPSRPDQSEAHALGDVLHRVQRLHGWVRNDARLLSQVTNDLQEEIRRARMLPVSTVFETFPRMVRDLAREQQKQVRLEIRGGETQMDRTVLEGIKAPLTHLLRNCVDHGMEDPLTRAEAGKSPEGTIVLSASQKGDVVSIEVADDGAGIDVERVKATALSEGGVREADLEEMTQRETLALIFRSGLSTSQFITSVSGRGVGLDVVRENIGSLNGTVEVDTEPGRGTTFTLVTPITVTTTKCILVRAGGQTLALPLNNISRTIRISAEDVQEVEGREAMTFAGAPLRLRTLADLLGIGEPKWEAQQPVLVAGSADLNVGLIVEEILGAEEIIMKNLPPPLFRVRHAAGAAILTTGEAVVVLNVADVVRSASRSSDPAAGSSRRRPTGDKTKRVSILLADDSITTRTLEKNILEAAGYSVQVAADGAAAWDAMQVDPPDIVVSDVEMPRLDGFELTEKIRSHDRFKHLPVVLVTSLESKSHRERGVDVGADAYIGKSSFDTEQLLDVVRRLI